MPKSTLPRAGAVDPLPALVADRFHLMKRCSAVDDLDDEEAFDRRLDEAQRRVRRLDEQIIRTVATSTLGLLAQLRVLGIFYEESANGSGRRGSLLIRAIAEGVAQLEKRISLSPTIPTRLRKSGGNGRLCDRGQRAEATTRERLSLQSRVLR